MNVIKRDGGFTLAEVMVVVLVIGITMAASLPAFSRYMKSNTLDATGEQIASHFRLFRQKAVAEGVPRILAFTSTTTYYEIVDVNGDGNYGTGETYDGPYYLPDGVQLYSFVGFSSSWISLRPNGTAAQSGDINFINDRGETIKLTLLGSTGQVVLDKG